MYELTEKKTNVKKLKVILTLAGRLELGCCILGLSDVLVALFIVTRLAPDPKNKQFNMVYLNN